MTRRIQTLLMQAVLLVALSSVYACERVERWLFWRSAPSVEKAVAYLNTQDAGDATQLLTGYLNTGRCKEGNLGTPDSLKQRPNATFDLGLALFQIAERYGQKFGSEAPPREPSTPEQMRESQQLVRRSADVECAQRVVRVIAADKSLPLELRAEAYYLSGNLEFLRHEYRAAVESYDAALALIPGGLLDGGVDVKGVNLGTKAAWNRSIALRRAEEEEKPPPDAGSPPPADGGGGENDEQDKDKDKQDEQEKEQDKDKNEQDEQEKAQDKEQDKQDPRQQQDQKPEPNKAEQPSPQERTSQNQDEQMLEMLEQAPLLQQQLPKSRARALGRITLEDK